uniref:THH1/TOM1/TOM3 domain-containing protein n=1 Tax=Lotharella oceanica TaxID=641309 RepID=A0A7S2X9I6_9EUKA
MAYSATDASIIMCTVASAVCLACIYSLAISAKRYQRLKLAATTQRTFVGLTLASAMCSVAQAAIPLSGVADEEMVDDIIDRLRVTMDLWCNTYLMIFWLKVHFFVRYRSETTLAWLWWAWAGFNTAFMVFKITISALCIAAYVQGDYHSLTYYKIDIAVNVGAYIAVPVVVGGFGIQLHQLFKRWGKAFSPALSATLYRIASGTIVVCVCFLLRAVVLLCVLGDAFSGQVPDTVYLFYFVGLTAIPQIIALYIMAILLPRQHKQEEMHVDSKAKLYYSRHSQSSSLPAPIGGGSSDIQERLYLGNPEDDMRDLEEVQFTSFCIMMRLLEHELIL